MRPLLSFLLLLITATAFSQINHIKVLIGKPEQVIRDYFDSLNKLKSNPAYKIERDATDEGGLILTTNFSLGDEDYYTCLSIATVFTRLADGREICTTQLLFGSSKNAQPNMAYIKDNYKLIKENYWERTITPKVKIGAEFKLNTVENVSTYTIIYSAVME
jgi:hypothetical protein